MNRRFSLALATFGYAVALAAASPAAALPPGGDYLECDTFLNIHRDPWGNIINWWISYENCTLVTGVGGGGGGTPPAGTEVEGIRPSTDCTKPAERGNISERCCECYKAAAQKWKDCRRLARFAGPGKALAVQRCAENAVQDASSCVAFQSCA